MVARITSLKSIAKALNYNEQKVHAGVAELVAASGFLKDPERLSFSDKIGHFKRIQTLNEKVVTNTLHVSLNFDPSERLSKERLQEIAGAYMEGIGFGEQPYLVYRHEDAGHPHIHIVSTNIRTDGSRISMHNLGRNESEATRKKIEEQFGLYRAEARGDASPLQSIHPSRIQYGKGALKQAIANVLRVVIDQYNYTSLEELNAVLKLYSLRAEKGAPGSRLDRYHGLQYQVLDERGEKVGVPIKASSFHSRPTLSVLEVKFEQNKAGRGKTVQRTRQVLDWVLQKEHGSMEALKAAAEKEGIQLVLRQGREGVLYGITYVDVKANVDVKAKLVVNGSELGKEYSAKGILEKLGIAQQPKNVEPRFPLSNEPIGRSISQPVSAALSAGPAKGILEELILPEGERDEIAYPLRGKKRKKKRRGG